MCHPAARELFFECPAKFISCSTWSHPTPTLETHPPSPIGLAAKTARQRKKRIGCRVSRRLLPSHLLPTEDFPFPSEQVRTQRTASCSVSLLAQPSHRTATRTSFHGTSVIPWHLAESVRNLLAAPAKRNEATATAKYYTGLAATRTAHIILVVSSYPKDLLSQATALHSFAGAVAFQPKNTTSQPTLDLFFLSFSLSTHSRTSLSVASSASGFQPT